jgi:hypothetical protein
MDANRVLTHVQKELKQLRAQQVEFVNSGRAADFAEYRYICGVIRGLDQADEFVNDLAKKMELSDE